MNIKFVLDVQSAVKNLPIFLVAWMIGNVLSGAILRADVSQTVFSIISPVFFLMMVAGLSIRKDSVQE